MHPIIQLRPLLQRAWSIDTTWTPETYEGKDPAWGQCGVTTLFLHDRFLPHRPDICSSRSILPDGTIGRHFWLMLYGAPIDETHRQFPIGTRLENSEIVSRDSIIENKWFQERYDNYRERVVGLSK